MSKFASWPKFPSLEQIEDAVLDPLKLILNTTVIPKINYVETKVNNIETKISNIEAALSIKSIGTNIIDPIKIELGKIEESIKKYTKDKADDIIRDIEDDLSTTETNIKNYIIGQIQTLLINVNNYIKLNLPVLITKVENRMLELIKLGTATISETLTTLPSEIETKIKYIFDDVVQTAKTSIITVFNDAKTTFATLETKVAGEFVNAETFIKTKIDDLWNNDIKPKLDNIENKIEGTAENMINKIIKILIIVFIILIVGIIMFHVGRRLTSKAEVGIGDISREIVGYIKEKV